MHHALNDVDVQIIEWKRNGRKLPPEREQNDTERKWLTFDAGEFDGDDMDGIEYGQSFTEPQSTDTTSETPIQFDKNRQERIARYASLALTNSPLFE